MLSTSVEADEGLLMQEHCVTMSIEGLLEDLHSHQVVENWFTGLLVNSTELELVVGHFIVLGFEGDADFQ